jgi:hypothetical protein
MANGRGRTRTWVFRIPVHILCQRHGVALEEGNGQLSSKEVLPDVELIEELGKAPPSNMMWVVGIVKESSAWQDSFVLYTQLLCVSSPSDLPAANLLSTCPASDECVAQSPKDCGPPS